MLQPESKPRVPSKLPSCARSRIILSSLCSFLPALLAIVLLALPLYAQSRSSPTPYASMNRDDVAYRGPDRGSGKDLPGEVTTVGILLPLQGKRAAHGALLRTAAQMALDDELSSARNIPGRRLALAFRDQSERWGQASSEMVQLIDEDNAVALITSTDGNIAHQAEQIANKIGIPILTLSSDATATRINIPWIFRLGPSDRDQAQLIAIDIYQRRKLRKVFLLAEDDHDGRVGSEEFLRAANLLQSAPPERVEFSPATPDWVLLTQQLKSREPDAIVLWSGLEATTALLPVLDQELSSAVVYLCSKAAQFRSPPLSSPAWFSASIRPTTTEPLLDFAARFRRQTGVEPTTTAEEMYDAVRVLAVAVRIAGPNRARVRDYLASGATYSGVSGAIAFDQAGNFRGEFALQVPVDPPIRAAF